ncbi:MAG: MFS transporter [Dermatophilus congolensis]|nr:MFS transporter [Dermatophilus congolensis]
MTTAQSQRSIGALVLSNVLGGVGVASGIAVGSLLVASMSSDAWAGAGQALSVLGAGLMAVPLARLATNAGRRRALTVGYGIAFAGAAIVLIAAAFGVFPLLLAGLLLFGAAQATTLQTRYAASELATPERRGTVMSIVIWATTIGSVTGPNLSAAGASLGSRINLPELSGPYLFSLAGFLLAALSVTLLYTRHPARDSPAGPAAAPQKNAISATAALRWAAAHPVARFAVVLLVSAHAVMVGIMSMTPLHLGHTGHGLSVVGIVISLHILGMYALSPLFGWMADKFGPMVTALIGLVTLGLSAVVAFIAPGHLTAVVVALTLLGLGWSAAIISSSVLLAGVDSGEVRVPLQGATDALMNYAGAAAALVGGLIIAAIGFGGLALTGLLIVLPAAGIGWIARNHRRVAGDPDPTR